MELKYPRFIHAEFMTHRVFSRNAASSRAIPVERMIQSILDDTAMPIVWTKNQPGMQGYEECNEWLTIPTYEMMTMSENSSTHVTLSRFLERAEVIFKEIIMPYADSDFTREDAWNEARDLAIYMARRFHAAGYHKQIVNRILEPYMHITVVVTATDWDNFYALRDHEAAEPHIQMLARAMKEAHEASVPKFLHYDQWHLPYVTDKDWDNFIDYGEQKLDIRKAVETSVARCARTSYVTTEGRPSTYEEDHALYERLVGSDPMHASPAEHQARPDRLEKGGWESRMSHGNFSGWNQYRKMLEYSKKVGLSGVNF